MATAVDDPLVQQAVQANLSPRYRQLDLLERYVDGTQYEGRPPFFSDDVPLFDRAPCIVVPMADEAIRSHAALVLGEAHFPEFTTHGGEDDGDDPDEEEGDLGLSVEDSAALDRLIGKIKKQTHLQPRARQLLEAAMGCGTAVAIASVRQGRLGIETTRAKWCTPKFLPDGELAAIEIRYPFTRESKGTDGKPVVEALLYRRVLDATSDTIYRPAKASRNGAEPDHWVPDTVVKHDLGFCPAIWYAHMAEVTTVGEIDGRALHRLLLGELDALNFAVSQRHRATLTTLDPILAEIGVDEDVQPAPLVAQASSIFMTPEQAAGEAANAGWKGGRSGQVRQGRKRAPGMAWQYPDPETKVELLTLPGDAFDAGIKNAADLEVKLAEALRWVPIDPKQLQIASTLSGKALEWLHKKQIEYCNEVRTDCGAHLVLALLSLLLRIVCRIGKRDKGGLYLAGVRRALPVLERFERTQRQTDGTTRAVWMPPEIDLTWPEYFPPTEVDTKATGDNVRADLAARIITRRTAVEKVARYYGIKNVEQYMEALEEEREASPPIVAPPLVSPAPVHAPIAATEPAGSAPPDSDAPPETLKSRPPPGK